MTTSRERQAARRLRLKKAAKAAGFETIDRLSAAILRGEITMTDNRTQVLDRETGEVLGKILANHSLSIDEAMHLIGAKWYDKDGGWSLDGGRTCYDSSTLELVTPE